MIIRCTSPSCSASVELPELPGDRVDVRPAEGWTFNKNDDLRWLCPRCTFSEDGHREKVTS